MKRILGILLAAALMIAPAAALAEYNYDSVPTPHILVVDADHPDTVFYERAADEQAYPASTTKIMTAVLALEAGNLEDSVTVGQEVTTFTNLSSLMGLQSGETVTMKDLVYGLMLVSGNDAAAAIAVHVGGSIDNFVSMMNQKAASLGMSNTHFSNPHGVQDKNHYTTARDMAKLASYALQNPDFCDLIRTESYTVPSNNVRSSPINLVNSNRLLLPVAGDKVDTTYPYAIGIKTGDTDSAGKCLVAAAERDGARILIILFGDKIELYSDDAATGMSAKEVTNLARFLHAKEIFTDLFDTKYATATTDELGLATTFSVEVANAREADLVDGKMPVNVKFASPLIRRLPDQISAIKAGAASITPEVSFLESLHAPIAAGTSVGTVRYTLNGALVVQADLVAAQNVLETEAAPLPTNPPANIEITPGETPLLESGHKDWGASDVLVLVLVVLIVLLVALVVIFIISERKRRYERKRRAAAKRRRQQQQQRRY
jgi:D-alanyl-D-alanine carboxypeptidase